MDDFIFENGLRKKNEISFSIKNVAFGFTLCHFENCFFLLYVCFRITTQNSVLSPDKLEYFLKHRSEY